METSRLCVGRPRNLTQRQTDPFPDVSAPTRLVPTCLRIWANNCRFLREGDRSLAIWKEARQVVEKERGCVCVPLLASVALRLCLLLGNWDQLAWSARVAHFQSPPSKSLRTTTICCKNMPIQLHNLATVLNLRAYIEPDLKKKNPPCHSSRPCRADHM